MEKSIYANSGVFFEDAGRDFQSEDQSDKMYSLVIDNSVETGTDKVIALCPGDGYTASQLSDLMGINVDAIIDDGTIVATAGEEVKCSGSPSRVKSFVRSNRRNPRRFTGLIMKVSNVDQFTEPIKIYKDDCYIGEPVLTAQINPSQFEDNNVNNEKLIPMPINHLQFDGDTIVLLKVKSGVVMTLRFNPGGTFNGARTLDTLARSEFSQKSLKRLRIKK